jgi:hypothetical protein
MRLLCLHCCSKGSQPWKQGSHSTEQSSSSSAARQQQQQEQQQQAPGSEPRQAGLTQEQVERDVQQLAGDVFHKRQELAGGR